MSSQKPESSQPHPNRDATASHDAEPFTEAAEQQGDLSKPSPQSQEQDKNEADGVMPQWRERALRLRGAAKVRAEEAMMWARKDSTKQAATAVGSLLAAAAIKTLQNRYNTTADPNAYQPLTMQPNVADGQTGAGIANATSTEFYPTPERLLRLDGTDRFVEWPHHQIAGLIVGVTQTPGVSEDKVTVRWDPYIRKGVIVEESSLTTNWMRPFDHSPAIPLELRLIAPRIVGFRFLAPGEHATGPSAHRPQKGASSQPITAKNVSAQMREAHEQSMSIIRNLRA